MTSEALVSPTSSTRGMFKTPAGWSNAASKSPMSCRSAESSRHSLSRNAERSVGSRTSRAALNKAFTRSGSSDIEAASHGPFYCFGAIRNQFVPSSFTRNAHWSADSSMSLAVGLPAP